MANKGNKPTNKQRDAAISDLYNRDKVREQQVNEIYGIARQLDVILGTYIEFDGKKEKFNKHVAELQEKMKKEQEENDAKKDGEADKPNLQGDTDGESSGSEGIREEGK